VAAVATLGSQWYTERQRRDQYPALRKLLASRSPAVVCGDFNALPIEVALGPRLLDAWTGDRYGATFPARLPAARIDQCWITRDLRVGGSGTLEVPSDHRALVIDLASPADPTRPTRSPGAP
jgi:endonuclease/exonuclease/phosphatase family metal-dependent hydrolase